MLKRPAASTHQGAAPVKQNADRPLSTDEERVKVRGTLGVVRVVLGIGVKLRLASAGGAAITTSRAGCSAVASPSRRGMLGASPQEVP